MIMGSIVSIAVGIVLECGEHDHDYGEHVYRNGEHDQKYGDYVHDHGEHDGNSGDGV